MRKVTGTGGRATKEAGVESSEAGYCHLAVVKSLEEVSSAVENSEAENLEVESSEVENSEVENSEAAGSEVARTLA